MNIVNIKRNLSFIKRNAYAHKRLVSLQEFFFFFLRGRLPFGTTTILANSLQWYLARRVVLSNADCKEVLSTLSWGGSQRQTLLAKDAFLFFSFFDVFFCNPSGQKRWPYCDKDNLYKMADHELIPLPVCSETASTRDVFPYIFTYIAKRSWQTVFWILFSCKLNVTKEKKRNVQQGVFTNRQS